MTDGQKLPLEDAKKVTVPHMPLCIQAFVVMWRVDEIFSNWTFSTSFIHARILSTQFAPG